MTEKQTQEIDVHVVKDQGRDFDYLVVNLGHYEYLTEFNQKSLVVYRRPYSPTNPDGDCIVVMGYILGGDWYEN